MKKTCRTCKFYSDDCGYWNKEHRDKNPTAGYVNVDCEHNCQDYERKLNYAISKSKSC